MMYNVLGVTVDGDGGQSLKEYAAVTEKITRLVEVIDINGKFIVFEGPDGSGKSTHAKLLGEHLTGLGHKVSLHNEPTSGPIGKIIRDALTHKIELFYETLALLFAADRREHIGQMITELNAGRTVICDRYLYSSLAYQALQMPIDRVYEYNRENFNLLPPDLVVFIDLSAEECFQRIQDNRQSTELFETLDYLRIVRGHYIHALKYAAARTNVITVSGARDLETVSAEICTAVSKYL